VSSFAQQEKKDVLKNRCSFQAEFARRKDFLPVEPQSDLAFLFLLGAPRFA